MIIDVVEQGGSVGLEQRGWKAQRAQNAQAWEGLVQRPEEASRSKW